MIPHRGFGYHTLDEGQLVVSEWDPDKLGVVMKITVTQERGRRLVSCCVLLDGRRQWIADGLLAIADIDKMCVARV